MEEKIETEPELLQDYDIIYVGPWRAKQINVGVLLERSLNQLTELLELDKELQEDV